MVIYFFTFYFEYSPPQDSSKAFSLHCTVRNTFKILTRYTHMQMSICSLYTHTRMHKHVWMYIHIYRTCMYVHMYTEHVCV